MSETWRDAVPKKPDQLSRRTFLAGAVSSAAVIGVGAKLYYDHNTESQEPEIVPEPEPDIESIPEPVQSEFIDELSGYSMLLPLRGDEVLFVDEHNVPIAPPVKIQMMNGEDPGVLNEHGVPIEGIRGQWLDAAREALKSQYPHISIDTQNDIPKQYNVVAAFRSALDQVDEPELVSGIENGTIKTYFDIVRYFAEKPVRGAEDMNRMQYVSTQIKFRDSVPAAVQDQLRHIIPALCVQESGFNNDLRNSASGARGIFQFIEDTWVNEYGRSLDEINSLRAQVEVAGEFFSDLYDDVRFWIGEAAYAQLRELCDGDEEVLVSEVLTPLMVNAYNAGSRRIGDAVTYYLASRPAGAPAPKGAFGVFHAITKYAQQSDEGTLDRYGEHASEYVPRIYGHFQALHRAASGA